MQFLNKVHYLLITLLSFGVSLSTAADENYIRFHSLTSDSHFEQLPVSTHINSHIYNIIARTSIQQTFINQTDEWLEGIYHFPLPDNAAVDALIMKIGDRIIKGEIQEKQQAEKTYQTAKKEGKKTSLVKQQRPNLFTTKLANIAPGETIHIEITFQHLIHVEDTQFRFNLPLGITPRYQQTPSFFDDIESYQNIPVHPDTSRLPEMVSTFNLGAQPDRIVTLNINLTPGFDIENINSRTHSISTWNNDKAWHIQLEHSTQADKDFELQWQPTDSHDTQVALLSETDENYQYHLLMLMPPTHALSTRQEQQREIIFIIDSSGSMSGNSMQQAKQSLQQALHNIESHELFNIIEFDDTTHRLFETSQIMNQANLDLAYRFINKIEANGGTNIRSAIDSALTRPNSPHLRQIVFLTDGSVGNEAEIFSLIHKKLGNNRLFTIGIGHAPNRYFMHKAAEAGRGSFTAITQSQQIQPALNKLFIKLRYPLLKDIQLIAQNIDDIESFPSYIPDLYHGEPLFISYRTKKNHTTPITIQGDNQHFHWNMTLPKTAQQNSFSKKHSASLHPVPLGIAKYWARMKIDTIKREQHMNQIHSSKARESILRTALEFGLVSDYTSLVAVDHTPENIQGNLKSLQLANRLPAGWSRHASHGYPQGGTLFNIYILLGLLSGLCTLLCFLFNRKQNK